MSGQIVLLILVGCAAVFCSACKRKCDYDDPLVDTPMGKMRGTIMTSRLGKSIYAFRSIRYAKPPLNELRFKPPVPAEKWEGTYNATKDPPHCTQPTFADPVSEDCLFLNVYTTKLPEGNDNPNRPVMVHFLPGGFYSVGSASVWAGPHYFMDQDIVLVTFNYRLATLGFLSLGNEDAPGNNGLKDQVQVLKWVQQNIASFGGNPNSVTIMGYSAGSWSITLHMVSPMSDGLFHKAIAMSGSALGNWPLPTNQINLAKKQARVVGCPDDTPKNIFNCLKTVSATDLGNSLGNFSEFGTYDPLLRWSPVIEKDFGQERFLTDHPIKLIINGKAKKVPFITGITKDEFGYIALEVLNNDTLTKEINENFDKVAPIAFLYERDSPRSKNISDDLDEFYLHDKTIDRSQLKNLANLYADSTVGFVVHRAAKLMAQYGTTPVYYYCFTYQGRWSHYYLPDSNNTIPYGVVHHDDLIYLFYISRLFPRFGKDSPVEAEMVDTLTSLYASFAKTGNPTPKCDLKRNKVIWEPYTIETQKYLDIGKELVMKENLYNDRYAEWEKLYPLSNYLTYNIQNN